MNFLRRGFWKLSDRHTDRQTDGQTALKFCITPLQARSQDFTLEGGGADKLRGCTFFSKKPTFFVVAFKTSSPSRSIYLRYLRPTGCRTQHFLPLIERTVLLHWIKQALRPNKASFSVKNPLNQRFGAYPLPPPGYTPAPLRGWSNIKNWQFYLSFTIHATKFKQLQLLLSHYHDNISFWLSRCFILSCVSECWCVLVVFLTKYSHGAKPDTLLQAQARVHDECLVLCGVTRATTMTFFSSA